MLFNKTKQVRIHWPVYVQFHFRTSVSALKKKPLSVVFFHYIRINMCIIFE